MRKVKAYFGQRRGKHFLGFNSQHRSVVPQLLRRYFALRRQCGMAQTALKFRMNALSGIGKAMTTLPIKEVMATRRRAKEGYLGRLSMPEMERLMIELERMNDVGLSQVGSAAAA